MPRARRHLSATAVRSLEVGLAAAAVVLAVPLGLAAPARAATAVSPPATIADDCSVDVSAPLAHWIDQLPADTTVVAPAGACYLVDEGLRLVDPQGLTVTGGVWRDDADLAAAPGADDPVFWLVGGSDVTLSDLTVEGADPGGYHPDGAFAAGVRSDGVVGLTVSGVDVDDVYGDGIELNALRGDGDRDGTIVNPTEQADISDVDIAGAGRQGISFVGVDVAQVDDVQISDTGLDTFDVEADQWDEGAEDVTIDGCTSSGSGGIFFANEGNGGGGQWTGNITVEDCIMDTVQAGDPVYIRTPLWASTPRGPFVFSDDTVLCGHSVSVSCLEVGGADVSVTDSALQFPGGTIHEAVYDVTDASTLDLAGDTVGGYGSLGTVGPRSTVDATGVVWAPFQDPAPAAGAAAPAGDGGTVAPTAVAHTAVAVRATDAGPASGTPLSAAAAQPGRPADSAATAAPAVAAGHLGSGRGRHRGRRRVRRRSGGGRHRRDRPHASRRSTTRS